MCWNETEPHLKIEIAKGLRRIHEENSSRNLGEWVCKNRKAVSPVFHVHRIKAPLFVAQGANDPRVNKAESDQIVEALRKLVPDLDINDLTRGGAGVRAQALTPDGALVDDFRIVEAKNMVHVLNAPSPAATASIAIGQSIAEMAQKNFGLK